MTLAAGTRLGPYEILTTLGAGGMGEVYRARDPRLGREIAVKVLPPKYAADSELLKRFEREARSASALNHPNIVVIHDVGTTDGIPWIAMEKVEGRTLGMLLVGGPLKVREVLNIAIQVADGLARAHEAGVLHRDLKPENLMVSKDGFVKILDFGLAKSREEEASLGGSSEASTKTVTSPGQVMGTVGYMSPEQARGDAVDFRSDQFSFGALLYEMATGHRAFRGKTSVDTLAAILNTDPEPIINIRPTAPAPLRWIVERCLTKDPQGRFSSTRDLANDLASLRDHLEELGSSPGIGTSAEATRGIPRRLAWAVGLGLAFLAVGAARLILAKKVPAPLPSAQFAIAPPPGTTFNFGSTSPAPPALSPDGGTIVFGVRDAEGQNELWLRPLNALEARPLPGTEGATYPFWSADGAFVGFFANGKLKKIDIRGGPPQTLCEAPEGRGGSWNSDGTILFAPSPLGPILRVSTGGGEAVPVTRLNPKKIDLIHRWPEFLPDGRHFLYCVHDPKPPSGQGIWLASLDSSEATRLLPDASNVVYARPGYLVFVREGALFAVPFDPAKLRVTGSPVSILKEVRYQPYRWYGIFSVSQTGVLAYQPGLALETSRMVWFDRSGKQVGVLGAAGDYEGLRLSPDGSRCVVEIRNTRNGTIDLWIVDSTRGVTTRLTSGQGINDSPVWSPDGDRIVFSSNASGHFDLYEIPSQGGREDLILSSDEGKAPTDWSSDGRKIVFQQSGPSTQYRWQVWGVSKTSPPPQPLLPQTSNQRSARLSSDGKWIAYCSDESGNQEVYVRAADETGAKLRVSTAGGNQPVWRRDSGELYYLSPDNHVMAVVLQSGKPLRAGDPQTLFEARVRDTASDAWAFDVTADGQRFLINTRIEGAPDPPLSVALNWLSGLTR